MTSGSCSVGPTSGLGPLDLDESSSPEAVSVVSFVILGSHGLRNVLVDPENEFVMEGSRVFG